MAYTRTPLENTEQNKQIPFLEEWSSRPHQTLTDSIAVNVVWDVVQNQATGENYIEAMKRYGLAPFASIIGPGEIVSGIYYWITAARVVFVGNFGTRSYTTSGVIDWTSVAILWNTTNPAGFTEFLFDNGTVELIISDGANLGRVTTAGVLTAIVDPDMPNPHIPNPVFLDGYLFLADTKANIWNSDLNNPSSWTASNFISGEAYPDTILALVRHNVYVVALGNSSIEYFYNAANPTGTPLAKYSASTPRIGYMTGLASHGEDVYFVGRAVGGLPNVYKMSGFKVASIGNETSARYLQNANYMTSVGAGCILNLNGHTLYTIYNIAVDLSTGLWTYLDSPLSAGGSGFALIGSAPIDGRSVGNFQEDSTSLVMFKSSGVVAYVFSDLKYQDNASNFQVKFQTKNWDFGTRRMKFGARLLLTCDQTPSTSSCSVSWTDNDYQSFSTARTVDLSNLFPHLNALGSFRKRAFQVTYSDNFPMRWSSIELDYEQGNA